MFKRARTTLGALAIALTLCVSAAEAQDKVETAYAAIKPSLVLVLNYHGSKLYGIGSGFVVGHRNGHMLVVTNRHVIEGGDSFSGMIQSPNQISFGLIPVKVGTSDDLALLESTKSDAPAVSLATTLPALGHAISIAGYPHTQLVIAEEGGGLTPSVHAGNVNALPEDGYYIQYDAQSDHGNSGGPLFDVDTGVVYGVVVIKLGTIETNFAISAVRLRTFLANAGVFPSSSPMVANTRAPDENAPIPATPAPAAGPSVAIDGAACGSAMLDLIEAFKGDLASFDRYVDSQNAAIDALGAARDHQSLVAANSLTGVALSVIQGIISDEPKISRFRERVAQTGATQTAQAVGAMITDMATRDQDAFQASLAMNYTIGVLLDGAAMDKKAANLDLAEATLKGHETNRMKKQVHLDFKDILDLGMCTR